MLLTALVVLFGAIVALYGNALPDPPWYAGIPLLLVAAFYHRRYRLLWLFAASYLFCSLSFFLALQQRLAEDLHDQTMIIRGEITSLVTSHPGRQSFVVSPVADHTQPGLPPRIRLTWYQDQVLPQPGSLWQLEVKLRPPRGRLNPGGFDYEKWLLVQGIGATGYVRTSDHNRLLIPASSWHLQATRHRLLQALRQACDDCATTGLINGLAVGYRGDISSQQRQLLLATGTAHLLAISGLHVGLISAMFFYLGHWLWRIALWRLPVRRLTVSSIMALCGAVGYAAMAGFSLPTQRALIFVVVVCLASLLRHRLNLLQCTAIAVIVTLVADPLAVGSASFWLTLSALCVIGITLSRVRDMKSRLLQGVILQVNFALLLAIPSLFTLGYFSLTSLPANLLAVPLVSLLILPLVFVATVLIIIRIPALAEQLLGLADYGLELLLHYLGMLAELDFSIQDAGELPAWLIILTAIILIGWWLPFPNPLRKLALVLLLIVTQWRPETLEPGDYRLTVLDSGLGNAIVVETRTHSLLYDFGPGFPDGYSTLDQVIKPYLGKAGFDDLDLFVISHVDHDHSGGFHSLPARDRERLLLSGTPEKVKTRFQLARQPRSCHDYPAWTWDGVEFQFLGGAGVGEQSSNNQSCVLSISGRHRALLPGDIERPREQALGRLYGKQLAAEVLVTPHHGSNTSSSQAFIAAVSPEAVVHTQSTANRWGFPHADVVQRYESLGTRQYRSGTHGAVVFTSTREGLQISHSRQPGQRIWR